MREQNYKEAVRANNPEALVAIIKMIYQRKQKRLAQGKKCTATDARYFQIAEICYIWNWELHLKSQTGNL